LLTDIKAVTGAKTLPEQVKTAMQQDFHAHSRLLATFGSGTRQLPQPVNLMLTCGAFEVAIAFIRSSLHHYPKKSLSPARQQRSSAYRLPLPRTAKLSTPVRKIGIVQQKSI